jgi:hypothetical protein
LPEYVTWREPPRRITVPRLAALTPDPAVADAAPLGNRSSGQIFWHLLVHENLLADLMTYSVLPLTKIVPYLVVRVETTTCFTL